MFGEQLRRAIRTGGVSQAELARRTGLTTATISRVASGEREASFETIDKLMDALGLEIVIRPRRSTRKGE
jgi:transcriptional regulator with XRE-family HTH domain